METVSVLVVIFLIVGFLRRLTGERDRARRRRPGTPARFLGFTGRRLRIAKRTHASSPEE